MSRGKADFSNVLSSQAQHWLLDLGELAARLWSPVIVEQGGSVLYMEDFRHGLQNWDPNTSGTGAAAVLHATYAHHGGFSVKLTAGSDGARYAGAWTFLSFPEVARTGIEASWTLHEETDRFEIQARLFTGTVYRQAVVWYSGLAGLIQYIDGDGNTVTLASNIDLYDSNLLMHTLKLVVDFDDLVYHRLVLDQTSYDMAGIPLQQVTNAGNPTLRLWLRHYGNPGENAFSYLDSVIVTRNEP